MYVVRVYLYTYKYIKYMCVCMYNFDIDNYWTFKLNAHLVALEPREVFFGQVFHLVLEFTIHSEILRKSNHLTNPTLTQQSSITAHLREISSYDEKRSIARGTPIFLYEYSFCLFFFFIRIVRKIV